MPNFARMVVELFRCRTCNDRRAFSQMFNRVMCEDCAAGNGLIEQRKES